MLKEIHVTAFQTIPLVEISVASSCDCCDIEIDIKSKEQMVRLIEGLKSAANQVGWEL